MADSLFLLAQEACDDFVSRLSGQAAALAAGWIEFTQQKQQQADSMLELSQQRQQAMDYMQQPCPACQARALEEANSALQASALQISASAVHRQNTVTESRHNPWDKASGPVSVAAVGVQADISITSSAGHTDRSVYESMSTGPASAAGPMEMSGKFPRGGSSAVNSHSVRPFGSSGVHVDQGGGATAGGGVVADGGGGALSLEEVAAIKECMLEIAQV